MTLRAKAALLLGLLAAALWSGAEAVRSLAPEKNANLPQEIYQSYARRAEAAEYVLRASSSNACARRTGPCLRRASRSSTGGSCCSCWRTWAPDRARIDY